MSRQRDDMSDRDEPDRRPPRRLTQDMLAQVGWASGEMDDAVEVAADDYYASEFAEKIVWWAQEMMFPEEWAAEMGVTEAIMFSWVHRFPEFGRAYAGAITILRGQFSNMLLRAATGRQGTMHSLPNLNPQLLKLIAEKRFPDLYGAPPEAPRGRPAGSAPAEAPRDVTPIEGGQLIDHKKALDQMTPAELEREMKELDLLRQRQASA